MTRSLTMNDYLVKAWNVQRGVQRVFSSCSKILGGRTDGTHGTDVTYRSQRSHRVSGGIQVPGVLMLFKSSSTRTSTSTIKTALLRC